MRKICFLVTISFFIISCKESTDKQIKFASWGGKFQADLVSEWVKPSSDTLAINLNAESWDGNYGVLKNRIKKGINTSDIVHVEDHFINNQDADVLFEELNFDTSKYFENNLCNKYGLPLLQYGYILAYDTINNKIRKPNWKDFFFRKNLIGKKGARDFPIGNIEIALLALGRDLNESLYNPLLSKADLEHQINDAFELFDKIKDEMVWWVTGDQLQRGLETNEFSLVASWSGRIWSVNNNFSHIKVNTDSTLISTDWLIIPKGSKNLNKVNLLLEKMCKNHELAKKFSISQGYFVPLKKMKLSSENSEKYIEYGSTLNNSGILIDKIFWSKNFTWISKNWKEWRSSN